MEVSVFSDCLRQPMVKDKTSMYKGVATHRLRNIDLKGEQMAQR